MNQKLFRLLGMASLLGALALASGCATAPESENHFERSAEPVVAQADWLASLHSGLTADLCSDEQVFRSCYTISEQDCHNRVAEAAAACESEYQPSLPEALSDAEGRHWGGSIGKCTGEGLFRAVSANYALNSSESCDKLLSDM